MTHARKLFLAIGAATATLIATIATYILNPGLLHAIARQTLELSPIGVAWNALRNLFSVLLVALVFGLGACSGVTDPEPEPADLYSLYSLNDVPICDDGDCDNPFLAYAYTYTNPPGEGPDWCGGEDQWWKDSATGIIHHDSTFIDAGEITLHADGTFDVWWHQTTICHRYEMYDNGDAWHADIGTDTRVQFGGTWERPYPRELDLQAERPWDVALTHGTVMEGGAEVSFRVTVEAFSGDPAQFFMGFRKCEEPTGVWHCRIDR